MKSALVACLVVVASSGCALADAGVFGAPVDRTAERTRDALSACAVRPILPACIEALSRDASPAWLRFGASPEELACVDAIDCGAADLNDDDVAESVRSDVFECLGTDDPAPLPPVDSLDELCQRRCAEDLDLFACPYDSEEEGAADELVARLDDYDACIEACRERLAQ